MEKIMEVAKGEPALNALLGALTRKIEETGAHAWRIYPAEYPCNNPIIRVVLQWNRKGGKAFVVSHFSFEPDTSWKQILVRLRDCVTSKVNLAEEEGTEFYDSPSTPYRKAWDTVPE